MPAAACSAGTTRSSSSTPAVCPPCSPSAKRSSKAWAGSVVAAAPDGAAQAQGEDQTIRGETWRGCQGNSAHGVESFAPECVGVATIARDEDAGVGRGEEGLVFGKHGRDGKREE